MTDNRDMLTCQTVCLIEYLREATKKNRQGKRKEKCEEPYSLTISGHNPRRIKVFADNQETNQREPVCAVNVMWDSRSTIKAKAYIAEARLRELNDGANTNPSRLGRVAEV